MALWLAQGYHLVVRRCRAAGCTRGFRRYLSSAPPSRLDLPAIDRKWQAIWDTERLQGSVAGCAAHAGAGKSYILPMFPYPSGTLHMGHLRVYAISDVLARFYKMRGHEVLHPMGWDAFGLPAENAAIERGVDPADWTQSNIAKMKAQIRLLSVDFDWDREFATCSPDFYEQTQRIFLMLYDKGLAYQAEALVNYDPVDKTVLANEQVDANGRSWRSGAKVEQLKLKQWFFRITAFQDALLKDLDALSGRWPESVLSMQRNWLGKSYGARIKFSVAHTATNLAAEDIHVFTTRPDTLYGVEYLALSLNHPIVVRAAETDADLRLFLDGASSLSPDSKVGYRLPQVSASHPMHAIDSDTPHLARPLPVFAAPYVLSDYGEGAVMGVPAHDFRDMAFFRENVTSTSAAAVVVRPESAVNNDRSGRSPLDTVVSGTCEPHVFTQEGILTENCGKYQGLGSSEAAKLIVADLSRVGRAEFVEKWRLRDWLISRQRYWGAPIPIIHCEDCGAVPVPRQELPVRLPKIEGDWLKGKKGNPLESSLEWMHTKCPSCGRPARRDTDTMDTFVDSSWYYLRFLDARNKELPFSPSLTRPVDIYIGGIEHAILHLLYARFIYKFLLQSDLFQTAAATTTASPHELEEPHEPFRTFLSQGMVHGKTYSDPATGRFLLPTEVNLDTPDRPLIQGTQVAALVSFEKMSKSKHNGVDPTGCALKYGADATRAHILFAAPVDEVVEWDESKIVGIERWYARLWKLTLSTAKRLAPPHAAAAAAPAPVDAALAELKDDADADAVLATHRTIVSVTHCIEKNPYGLNTVISDLIKLTNLLTLTPPTSLPTLYLCLSSLLRLLAPVAPALTSECWELLHSSLSAAASQAGNDTGTATGTSAHVARIFDYPWPTPLLSPEQMSALSSRGDQSVAVQINGKLRFTVKIPRMKPGQKLAPSERHAQQTEQTENTEQAEQAEQEWILAHLLRTAQGRTWLREKHDWEKRKRVVVVAGGKLVNIVF